MRGRRPVVFFINNVYVMKEDISRIFGKEWKWFSRLTLMMKLRVVWFLTSFCLLCCLSAEESGVLCVLLLCLNLCASAIALGGVSSSRGERL